MSIAQQRKPRVPANNGESHGITVLAVGPTPAERPGMSLHLAATANEAVELLRVLQFDLLVISNSAPDMETWDLAAQLQQYWPWQKWILVSEALTESDQRRAYAAGACGIFGSFPTPIELIRTLR